MRTTMNAMCLTRLASLTANSEPLQWMEVPMPTPRPNEVLLRGLACGVCHTELDEIEGRMAPPRLPVVPGHQVVGRVIRLGREVTRLDLGDRVGVGWIHSSSGRPDENLSEKFVATGRDVDGGYADYMAVPQDYAFVIPSLFGDAAEVPLRPQVERYDLRDANRALRELAAGKVRGAKVLTLGDERRTPGS